jgi:hypothetical protein
VSRVRNADEFLLEFRRIRKAYEGLFPLITQIRAKYTGEPEKGVVDQSLEAHAREYAVNAFLAALNWRLNARPEDGLPSLIPEVPIRSEERGSIRFLDYLGLESHTVNPLMIVETKRPNAQLPSSWEPASTYLDYSEVVSRGLAGEPLKGEWNAWLQDLRDYLDSAYARAEKVPKRVVMTNGNWLIVFLDPSDAFQEGGTRDPDRVLVFRDNTEIESRFSELFLRLEYQQVLGETPALTPVELSFHLSSEVVDRAMHGLHLRYVDQCGIYQHSPVIKVAPVVFVRSMYGGWLRVETPPHEYELPHKTDRLQRHLDEVHRAARDLLAEVNRRLGTSLSPFPLSRHYEGEDGFEALRGVVENSENEYLVVTGEATHYLLPRPSVPNCPYHDWTACNRAGVAFGPAPIVARSTSPRSFFISEELHHCAHRDVNSAKAALITSANRQRCGARSGQEGQAFCEIWRFELHLCCRTCAFEGACTKATVFQLPC